MCQAMARSEHLRKLSGLTWVWLSLVIVGVDQWSKQWVVTHMVPGQVIKWLPFFNLRLAYNPGAAFSFLSDASGWQRPVLSGITILVTLFLIEWLRRAGRTSMCLGLCLSMIIGGAIGNLIDRLRLAYVIDFFDFHIKGWHFATFNVADAAISVGAVLLLLCVFASKQKN